MVVSGSQTISTLLKDDGSYILPLNSLRTADVNNYYKFSDQNLNMQFVGDDLSKSNVVVSLKQTNPVPTVTLSKNYDFTLNIEPLASSSGQLENFPALSETKSSTSNVSITSPTENESFTDQQPLFQGTSLPNSTVKIVIHSENETTSEVKSNANGYWSFRPNSVLSPGEHSITITAKDSGGISRIITQNFVVFAEGTQVTESATPSATPVITASPTPTIVPTTTPTPLVIPTSSVSLTPTPTSEIPAEIINTPTPTLPPTGNPSVVGFGILGLAITLFGGLLFLLARKSIPFI